VTGPNVEVGEGSEKLLNKVEFEEQRRILQIQEYWEVCRLAGCWKAFVCIVVGWHMH